MAASPPPPGDPKPAEAPKEDPAPPPAPPTCRVCAKESEGAVSIFSDSGRERGLPEKCQQCLPVLVRDDDIGRPVCLPYGEGERRRRREMGGRVKVNKNGLKDDGWGQM